MVWQRIGGEIPEPWAGSKSLRIARSIPVSIQVLCDMSARGVIAHSVDAFVDEPVGPLQSLVRRRRILRRGRSEAFVLCEWQPILAE